MMTLLLFTSIPRNYKPSLTLFVALLLKKKNSFKRILKVLTSFFFTKNGKYIIKLLDDSLLVLIGIILSYSLPLVLKT